ncbi:hypothetical protein J8J27_28960, partial [Mycobacterium tuberculosis]|nr:hypothetical protein [Mycobacterium tuberculosis]
LTLRLLAVLGVPAADIAAAVHAADHAGDGADAASVLIAAGRLDPTLWWPALAGVLGLAYCDPVEPVAAAGLTAADLALARDLQQIWVV